MFVLLCADALSLSLSLHIYTHVAQWPPPPPPIFSPFTWRRYDSIELIPGQHSNATGSELQRRASIIYYHQRDWVIKSNNTNGKKWRKSNTNSHVPAQPARRVESVKARRTNKAARWRFVTWAIEGFRIYFPSCTKLRLQLYIWLWYAWRMSLLPAISLLHAN